MCPEVIDFIMSFHFVVCYMRGLPKMICNFSAFYQSSVSFMEKGRCEEGTNDKEYNITKKINMPGERGENVY